MTNNKKTILIGTLPPPLDGQSVAFKVLADHYKTDESSCEVINISGRRIRNRGSAFSKLFRYYDYLFVLVKLVLALMNGYSVLYLQIAQSKQGFLRDKWMIKLALLFKSKIIVHLHGGNYDGFYKSLHADSKREVISCLKNVDTIVILSEHLRHMFDFEPSLNTKLKVIANGAGQPVKQIPAKRPFAENINILYLSNLVETKGYRKVLDAVDVMVNQYKLPVKAKFCGRFYVDNDKSKFSTVEEAKLDFFNTINAYHLNDCVEYKGVVEGVEKQNLLNEAHFFVLPTQYINEGQPISIIEAMRAGCVVLASDYRAIPEMIKDGQTGYLLKTGHHQEIADIIKNCYQQPDHFRQISMNAFIAYNEKYTEIIHCKNLASVIDEVASSGKLSNRISTL